jgi:hypothetical protein
MRAGTHIPELSLYRSFSVTYKYFLSGINREYFIGPLSRDIITIRKHCHTVYWLAIGSIIAWLVWLTTLIILEVSHLFQSYKQNSLVL